MRAAVLAGPQRIVVEDVPLPAAGPGEVRVRIEGCGVCASNVPPWAGLPWMRYPLEPGAPGHEGWGEVDEVGPGVRTVRRGQRVALLSARAYAEFDVAPESAAVPLPQALDGQPFPGEALGCAFNVFRRSAVRPGDTVAVVGIGFLGAVLTRLASQTGAQVVALSRRAFARETARAFGAALALSLADRAGALQAVSELTSGRGCDVVIEAVGMQEPLDLAAELTGERGRLVIAGYHQDGPRQVNMQLWNWRGLDVVNAHERDPEVYRQGVLAAVAAVASGALDPSPLFTHRYGLDELGQALAAAQGRPDGFIKGLVVA